MCKAILDSLESLGTSVSAQGGDSNCVYLSHDSYYRDQSHLSIEERAQLNFDHPNSLDTPLLIEHVKKLMRAEPIEVPQYDFTTHRRLPTTVRVESRPVIIIDGILIFADPDLRDLLDVKIFVDTEADIRLIRRLSRDTAERGRSVKSIIEQYIRTVKPMHDEFVEPSKRFADVIIPNGANKIALDMICGRLQQLFMKANTSSD